MAFTATELVTLSEILGISPHALDMHLEYVTGNLSTEAEDAIQADIVLWASYRNTDDVAIHPKESNFGAEIQAGGVRNAIIRRIATWLDLDLSLGSQFFVRTERS